MRRLFHIALASDWDDAQQSGAYRVSTLGRDLDTEGFIHLSYAHQVKEVADCAYRGRSDLLLLTIDADRLRCPVVVEDLDGSGNCFPHAYGELNVDAVAAVRPYLPHPDGSFDPVADSSG
jgi:glutathione S-transferase